MKHSLICFAFFSLPFAIAACGNDCGSATRPSDESSSSVANPKSSFSAVLPDLTGNLLTDSRDGQTYRIVTIGTQTWMAENLNYETANSYCYSDTPSNCTKYGRLYTWATAMDSAGTWSSNGKGCGYGKTCSPTYPVRGICPTGWHLPTKAEFEKLLTAVGGESIAGKKLKSTSGWNGSGNGTDEYSFSALPAGNRFDENFYDFEGNYADFWSSSEYISYAYHMTLNSDAGVSMDYYNKEIGVSVRCVKD